MKHTVTVTLILLGIFFVSQVIGLFVINNYVDHPKIQETGKVEFTELPLAFERPEVEETTSFLYIIIAIVIGTLLALVLIHFKQQMLWKFWFFVAVFLTLTIAFNAFIPSTAAIVLGLLLAGWKIFRPNFYVHNFTEFFIYGGLAAIFVPILNIFAMVLLLFFISAYDMYAVWKSKHMVKLAKFQTKSAFAGVMIPYKLPKLTKKNAKKKVITIKTAILGGGDIGFPLLFAGVVLKDLLLTNTAMAAIGKVLIIPIFTTFALSWLFFQAEKDKFYPAMPAISIGCFLGLIAMKLIGFF